MRADERDAQPLRFGAAGAVVGLLAAQIRLDAALVERAENDAAKAPPRLGFIVPGIQQ